MPVTPHTGRASFRSRCGRGVSRKSRNALPGFATLAAPEDMPHGVGSGRRLQFVPVSRLKSVPPAMVRRDPFILDLELVSHPLRYLAARRIATSAITIRFEHREQWPVTELTTNLANVIEETLADQSRMQCHDPCDSALFSSASSSRLSSRILMHHMPPIWQMSRVLASAISLILAPVAHTHPLAPANDRPLFASFGQDPDPFVQRVGTPLTAPVFAFQSGHIVRWIGKPPVF